ncbi:MAG: hypothetical protein ABI212_13835 [Burkholderiaceae bacterium]
MLRLLKDQCMQLVQVEQAFGNVDRGLAVGIAVLPVAAGGRPQGAASCLARSLLKPRTQGGRPQLKVADLHDGRRRNVRCGCRCGAGAQKRRNASHLMNRHVYIRTSTHPRSLTLP